MSVHKLDTWSNSTGNVGINDDTNTIGVLSKLLPFLVTNDKGDFRDFATSERAEMQWNNATPKFHFWCILILVGTTSFRQAKSLVTKLFYLQFIAEP